MIRSFPFLALLIVGCAAPSTETVPASPVSASPTTAPATPTASKGVEALPPTNIGDGSPIVFTHWKGIRKGSGSLVQLGKTTKIESFDLELNPDRTMSLSLNGKPESTLKGTWQKKDGKTVDLDVPGTAKGTLLFMDRANPYQLSLKGETFALNFRASE